MKLEIVKGSVVYAKCDAIVNAANSGLQGGAGVCGAIFSSAGWNELQEECNAIGGCRTGHAVMTNGYKLKAKHIIHAVGPDDGNEEKLRQAFYNVLVIADSNNLKTVALVPISTGIYGFPLHKCAQIAIKVVDEFKPKSLEHCYMYCYGDGEYQTFEYVLGQYLENKN
ncbi:MAG: macro domain-containing protein [Bacilli bacterium]|nr:macro domain-containing protein [Bacilli bacterium]